MVNLYSVNHDANVWSDPEVFKPERHLDSEGKLIKTDKLFFPFGAGTDESIHNCTAPSPSSSSYINNFSLFDSRQAKVSW